MCPQHSLAEIQSHRRWQLCGGGLRLGPDGVNGQGQCGTAKVRDLQHVVLMSGCCCRGLSFKKFPGQATSSQSSEVIAAIRPQLLARLLQDSSPQPRPLLCNECVQHAGLLIQHLWRELLPIERKLSGFDATAVVWLSSSNKTLQGVLWQRAQAAWMMCRWSKLGHL